MADSGSDEEGSVGLPVGEEERDAMSDLEGRSNESNKKTRQKQKRKSDAASAKSLRAEIDSW